MGKVLPILLALIGLGGGVGAGVALRPTPEKVELAHPCGDVAADTADEKAESEDPEETAEDSSSFDYVKMNNQFVVPVVVDGQVGSLVVMTLNLEVSVGETEAIYAREPKLRDALLRVMFDHANAGGFRGEFTESGQLNVLRAALREAAQKTIGKTINDVLILDIVRQDA